MSEVRWYRLDVALLLCATMLMIFAPGSAAASEPPRPGTPLPLSVQIEAGQVRDVSIDLGQVADGDTVRASIELTDEEAIQREGSPRIKVGLGSSKTQLPEHWPDSPLPKTGIIDISTGEDLDVRILAHRCSPEGVRTVPIRLTATWNPDLEPIDLPLEIRVSARSSCAPIYIRGGLFAGLWLAGGVLGLSLWGAAIRGSFLVLSDVYQRLLPIDEGGFPQERSQSLLKDALNRTLSRSRRARAFLRWWLRHPVSSLSHHGAYRETVFLVLGRSAREIAVTLLDRGRSFEDLENEPRRAMGRLVARAGRNGRTTLHACTDTEGCIGLWCLGSSRATVPSKLCPLNPEDSLEPRSQEDDFAMADASTDPARPARWKIQSGSKR